MLATKSSIRYPPFMNRHAVVLALLSAALFGVSTPAAKALLGAIDRLFSRACFIAALASALRSCGVSRSLCWRPTRQSRRRLVGRMPGSQVLSWRAVLLARCCSWRPVSNGCRGGFALLTLEGVATAVLAWFVFHENFDHRVALGMAASLQGDRTAWKVAPLRGHRTPRNRGACVAWGLDNNLTRKVSLADPLQIVELKGLIAGPFNLALGLWADAGLPAGSLLLIAGIVGFVGDGVGL